jgi:NFU1 iron-sulfur cluster scaffold homolog, mitochondrial
MALVPSGRRCAGSLLQLLRRARACGMDGGGGGGSGGGGGIIASHARSTAVVAAPPRPAAAESARRAFASSAAAPPLRTRATGRVPGRLPRGAQAPPARTLFIQTQPTPNSDAVMFLPGRQIMPRGQGSADFPSVRAATKSPLARKLFAVDGVRAVFFGADFVTVTKHEAVDWAVLRPEIFAVVMDFFISEENPVVIEDGPAAWNADTAIRDDDSEVVQMIKELLETRVKPAVAEDGGSIVFRAFHEADGTVDLELQGACSTCSSSSITLKNGVENMLRHYIPEVKTVREVPGEHAGPIEKENLTQFNKVEQQLKDSGILRS